MTTAELAAPRQRLAGLRAEVMDIERLMWTLSEREQTLRAQITLCTEEIEAGLSD